MSLFKKKKQPLPSEIQDNDEKTLTSATEQNKYAADILLDSCPTKQIITSLNDVLEATYPSCKQKVYEIDQAVLALIKENIIDCKHYILVAVDYSDADKRFQLHVNYRVATIKRLLDVRDKFDMGEIDTNEVEMYKDILEEYNLFEKDAALIEEMHTALDEWLEKGQFKESMSYATCTEEINSIRSEIREFAPVEKKRNN